MKHAASVGTIKRILVVIASAGWLAPLCICFHATYDFIWNVVWPAAAFDRPYRASWHPFAFADELFYISMAWLALVIIGWSIALTRRRRPPADGLARPDQSARS